MNTPIYIFHEEEIRLNYRKLSNYLQECRLYYTLKTNAEKIILGILENEGAFFECASVGEYTRILNLGIQPEKTIFGLPIKTDETIMEIYRQGGRYFVFEDLLELKKINILAPDAKKIVRLYINDIACGTIDYGMPLDMILKNESGLLHSIDGVSFHISMNTDLNVFNNVCKRVDILLKTLNLKQNRRYILNIGGGFHLNTGKIFFDGVNRAIDELKSKYDIDVYAEPGESLVGSAGRFYTKVIMARNNGHAIDLYIDSGIPQGIARRRPPVDVRIYGIDRRKASKSIYRFIDCTGSGKILFIKRSDLDIHDDDILEFDGCGAYTTVFQNEFCAYEKCPIIYT